MKKPNTKSDPKNISTSAAALSIGASVAALIFLAALHLLSPEFDPARRMVSEYALGHYGWVLSLMFFTWGLGSWSLAFAIRSQAETIPFKIGLILLILAGVGEAMASVFDVSHPVLHNLAGLIGIPSLPIAAMLVTVSLVRSRPWAAARPVLLSTAILTWVSLALMAAVMPSPNRKPSGQRLMIGWPNRILVAVYCLWVVCAARQAIRIRHKEAGVETTPAVN